jgi:hypothetical protein
MTAALGLISGTSSAPGLSANSDAASGLYFPASGTVGLVAKGAIGLKVSGQTYGAISATVAAGGSGYAVGDTIYTTGGTSSVVAAFTVSTVSTGVVTAVTMTVPGLYTVTPSNPAAQGSTSGSGSGCTLTVTYNNLSSPVYNLGITDLSNNLLWQAMGGSSFVSGLMAKANGFDYAIGIGASNLTNALNIGTGISRSSGTITAPATPIRGSYTGDLSVKVATTTTVAVAASGVVVTDGTNFLTVAPSATCNLGTNGAVNTLDAGTIAVNTWYYIYVIYNPTTVTTGTLASTSSTTPTLPSGYTYKARVGAVQTINGSATLYGTWQLGNRGKYVVGLAQTASIPVAANGTAGTYSKTSPALASVSLTRFVPTTAIAVSLMAVGIWKGGSSSNVLVAPSTAWGGTNMGPEGSVGMLYPFWQDAGSTAELHGSGNFSFELEAQSFAWCSDAAGGAVAVVGWIDNIP